MRIKLKIQSLSPYETKDMVGNKGGEINCEEEKKYAKTTDFVGRSYITDM